MNSRTTVRPYRDTASERVKVNCMVARVQSRRKTLYIIGDMMFSERRLFAVCLLIGIPLVMCMLAMFAHAPSGGYETIPLMFAALMWWLARIDGRANYRIWKITNRL